MDSEKIKVGAWSALGGAAVAMYIGFNVAGWMTGGAAAALAKEASATAVAERLGTICVAQFDRDAAKSQKLVEMKGKDDWEKGRYIIMQSWAIMPGEEKADSAVADACAKQLSRQTDRLA
jgi:hypothetical protein